jgi:phenylacetate-coenzyme A ligase PaaK-like adenylate-forming protein
MLDTALAKLRTAASLALGFRFNLRALEHLVSASLATLTEFGSLSIEGKEMLQSPTLDAETRQDLQLRRFRKQLELARETPYYEKLFAPGNSAGLLTSIREFQWPDIQKIPLTPKEDLRSNSDAFVHRNAIPYLRTTTGTTGHTTNTYFSHYEIRLMNALKALGHLSHRHIGPQDIVQMCTSSRATLGNSCLTGACALIGATVYMGGIVEPELTLAMLAEQHHLPGKKSQTSVISTYPSYLGELVEAGVKLGYRPSDFRVERVFVGGEIVTEGLLTRARALFGEVEFLRDYSATETLPFAGQICSQGHLHYEPSLGLMEVINPETGQAARDEEAGTVVITPFPPFRETTILLRYDTQDVVKRITGPLTCEKKELPATTNLFGKLKLSMKHKSGWIYPRQILEALESLEEVPLPARCGFWASEEGVAVEVLVRQANARTEAKIERRLHEQGVPLCQLRLVTDRHALEAPFPLRCDLRENLFGSKSHFSGPDQLLPRVA